MGAVRAELLKLKRSLSWGVVGLLPTLAVITGTVNFTANRAVLRSGWDSLWSQVVLFYGLFYLAMGVAVLGSLVWRVEHRGSNWNALLGRSTSTTSVVVAKLVAGLDGWLPLRCVVALLVATVACTAVAALQSGLSMVLRSFAAPVAMALLGVMGSVGILLGGFKALAVVSPYALVQRATQLGSTATSDASGLSLGSALGLLIPAAVLSALLLTASVVYLNRRDIR